MSDDAELLRRFVAAHSEEAFAELVRQHLGFVYHTALRHVDGDVHAAEDVAQAVFIDLARKAPRLTRHTVLAGWLHTSTRYAALHRRRTERRRQVHEQEAHVMEELTRDSQPSPEWERLRPVIDESLHALNPGDRDAILLRFFEGHGFAEVGRRLNLTEDGARLRVNRALDKLHGLLARRGVTSTVGALGLVLSGQSAAAAPGHLVHTVTAAAMGAKAPTAIGLLEVFRRIGPGQALATVGIVLGLALLVGSIQLGASSFERSPPRALPPRDEVQLKGAIERHNSYLASRPPGDKQEGSMIGGGLYCSYEGDISAEMARKLDLDEREIRELKRHYLDAQVELKALINPTAQVTASSTGMVIEYDFDPTDLHALERRFDGTIRGRILDSSSIAAYAGLSEGQAIANSLAPFGSAKMPKPTGALERLGNRLLERDNATVLRVEIFWVGTGAATTYLARFQSNPGPGSGWSVHPPATILKRFYGDLIRQARPEVLAEVQAAAARPASVP